MLEAPEDDVARASDLECPARVGDCTVSTPSQSATRRRPGKRRPDGELPRQRRAGGRRGLPADDVREDAGAELLDWEHNQDETKL